VARPDPNFIHPRLVAPLPAGPARAGSPIVVLRRGGLGNQLFQHAAALAAARATGAPIHYTVTDEPLRAKDPQLEDLVGPLPAATTAQLARFLWPPPWTPRRFLRLARRLRWSLGIGRPVWRLADGLLEQAERPYWGDGMLFDSMFLSPACYEPGLARVVDEVLARRPAWAVRRPDITAVNFRTAADFGRNGWVLPWTYCEAALEAIDPARSGTIWAIGDEPAAARAAAERLREAGWRVDTPEAGGSARGLDDFWNLARAGRLVMSASTFTWWAAVVGDAMAGSDGRLVACPDPWQPPRNGFLRRPTWRAVGYHGATP